MNTTKRRGRPEIVSVISIQLACLLLPGCVAPRPSLQTEGPRVHPEIIVLTRQQADELGIRVKERAGAQNLRLNETTYPDARVLVKANEIAGLTRAPVIRSYQVARQRDPADSRILHEAHTVYRIEADGDWVLESPEPVSTNKAPLKKEP